VTLPDPPGPALSGALAGPEPALFPEGRPSVRRIGWGRLEAAQRPAAQARRLTESPGPGLSQGPRPQAASSAFAPEARADAPGGAFLEKAGSNVGQCGWGLLGGGLASMRPPGLGGLRLDRWEGRAEACFAALAEAPGEAKAKGPFAKKTLLALAHSC
jgi:hypothetical protein